MKLQITYHNTNTGERDEYTTTLSELTDSFNGTLEYAVLKKVLENSGKASLENGYATTTIKMTGELYRTHDDPPYDTSREELIANLVEPTLELQEDTEDSIREWLIANPKVGDIWQEGGNDLAIERIK